MMPDAPTTSEEWIDAAVANFDLEIGPESRFVVGGEAEETSKSMASLMRAFLVAVTGSGDRIHLQNGSRMQLISSHRDRIF